MATILNAISATTLNVGGLNIVADGSGTLALNAASGLIDASGANGAFIVPQGNTLQRSTSTAAGQLRYNTTTGSFEGYSANAWGSIGGGGGASSNVASVTGNVYISSAGGVIDASNASIGFVFPTGTYNQRPTAVANGTTRWNSSNNWLEVYTGSTTQWVTLAYGGQYLITYMIVAGGGGGGSDMGGGGGAGGYLSGTALVTPGLAYTISVGGGGAGAPAGSGQPKGSNGTDSTFGRLAITSTGGGGGGSEYGSSATYSGNPGGSGGGAACQSGTGGSGTSGQGYPGGNGGGSYYGGGGGGAGGAGAGSGGAANGGIGVQNSILGTNYYWAGGGGGSGYSINGGVGGAGGGGGGAISGNAGGSGINSGASGGVGATGTQANVPGGNAGQYTGGGGGGGSHYNATNQGGSGGAGIIIITYVAPQRGTGGTITTVSGNPVHTFYSSGTFTA